MTSNRSDRIRARLAPLRETLLAHPIHDRMRGLDAVRVFMESHVFAVWDFMSLLKALQVRLCCVDVPWTPPADPAACRLVNEIVLAEESDVDEAGNAFSHFDLYLRAMKRCGAETGPVERFVREVREGRPVRSSLEVVEVPGPVRAFVGHTFGVIEGGDVCAIASAFTFGREGLLPDVFRRIVGESGSSPGTTLDLFGDYLNRHIGLDEGEHGPMAEQLVERLCGDDPARWRTAEEAAVRSLMARTALWDGIGERLGRVGPP